jgi:hypothetical protein
MPLAVFRYDRFMADDADDGTTLAARRVVVAQRIIAEQRSLIERLKATRRDTAGCNSDEVLVSALCRSGRSANAARRQSQLFRSCWHRWHLHAALIISADPPAVRPADWHQLTAA